MKRTIIALIALGLLLCGCKTTKKAEETAQLMEQEELSIDTTNIDLSVVTSRIDTSDMIVTITKTEYDTDKLDSFVRVISQGSSSAYVGCMYADGSDTLWGSEAIQTILSHPVKSVTTITAQKKNGVSENTQTEEKQSSGSVQEKSVSVATTSSTTEEKDTPVAQGTKKLFGWIGGSCMLAVLLAFLASVYYVYREHNKDKA